MGGFRLTIAIEREHGVATPRICTGRPERRAGWEAGPSLLLLPALAALACACGPKLLPAAATAA